VRKLSAEEQLLWARVAETIRPLSRNPVPEAVAASAPVTRASPTAAAAAVAKPPKGRVPPPRPNVSPPPSPRLLQASTLDGGWDRRLRAGNLQPDRTLDLHGHNLDRAWEAIDRMLEQAIDAGDRVVLLVTGHERRGEPPIERGRIRAAVNDWLAASRHSSHIAAVRPAHRRHGGGGSLYIILRRR
jgi:DNA-nicking Smr family endonuclease